jgi:hypothetical protein
VEAFRLLEVAMQQSATDHATGQINLAWLGLALFILYFFFPHFATLGADGVSTNDEKVRLIWI